jgi:hypothetical protein
MNPDQIKHREYLGIGALICGVLLALPSIGHWLIGDGSLTLLAVGMIFGAAGLIAIASLPEPDAY